MTVSEDGKESCGSFKNLNDWQDVLGVGPQLGMRNIVVAARDHLLLLLLKSLAEAGKWVAVLEDDWQDVVHMGPRLGISYMKAAARNLLSKANQQLGVVWPALGIRTACACLSP